MKTTVSTRRKYFAIMTVSFLLLFASIYVTKTTWTVSDKRMTDDHGEPLFHENNTPAYEDNIAWTSFVGLVFSGAMLVIVIFTVFVSVMEWLYCEEPYLFPPKFKTETPLKNIADNYDEE